MYDLRKRNIKKKKSSSRIFTVPIIKLFLLSVITISLISVKLKRNPVWTKKSCIGIIFIWHLWLQGHKICWDLCITWLFKFGRENAHSTLWSLIGNQHTSNLVFHVATRIPMVHGLSPVNCHSWFCLWVNMQ